MQAQPRDKIAHHEEARDRGEGAFEEAALFVYGVDGVSQQVFDPFADEIGVLENIHQFPVEHQERVAVA